MKSITKNQWIELCQKYNKWCEYETVQNSSYEQAENFIKNMPCFVPMEFAEE